LLGTGLLGWQGCFAANSSIADSQGNCLRCATVSSLSIISGFWKRWNATLAFHLFLCPRSLFLTTVWVNSCLYCANRCTFVLSPAFDLLENTSQQDCKVSFYKELTGRTKVLERLAENGHPRASISAKRKRVEFPHSCKGARHTPLILNPGYRLVFPASWKPNQLAISEVCMKKFSVVLLALAAALAFSPNVLPVHTLSVQSASRAE